MSQALPIDVDAAPAAKRQRTEAEACAAEVIPALLLGAHGDLDGRKLDELGVTHLLNCSRELPDPARHTAAFATWRVPVSDDVHEPLHEHLAGASAFLDAALASGGRVCAFCADGRSCAPAVVAYYLMRHHAMSLAAALDALTSARPDAQPNIGFWQRLIEAESWLRGFDEPSVSLQQYKWRFLQRCEPGAARGALLQQLELGRAEVNEMIRVRSEQWTATVEFGPSRPPGA